jgi:hypothetical protein
MRSAPKLDVGPGAVLDGGVDVVGVAGCEEDRGRHRDREKQSRQRTESAVIQLRQGKALRG